MAQFRSLQVSDVREILIQFGFAPDEYQGHQPIAVGTVNTNLRVQTARGPRFLRINEGKTLDDVVREAAIVAFVEERGVPTPAPAVSTRGEPFARWAGQFASLFPWRAGRTLVRPEVTPAHAAQAGTALAKLHRAGEAFPDHRPGRYEPDEIDRRLVRIEPAAGVDAAVASALAILRPELLTLARERRPDVPIGLIHGDLFIDNVLYDGPELAALLDFEQASWGRWVYDVAVTLLA
ncbi:MAG TPA: phosphotransferase, partial [Polyangia bacterium]|nr:phosphotransferase [Polyangia bacterium]